ncbi:hypothetical protein RCH09_002590 [Actimicrobium sp. GrIS 1.19]|uniref:hypothetical protein n=1 Tax=Actimicrobium sp. GrIS 1.19 TaxID=3071708 RepID=UPI002E09CC89|nr:hypothetical protein [Actimicrobium sp. GrIS 1.19]
MTINPLPFRATTAQACDWLAQQSGTAWNLARLIECGVTPYVWLDYDAAYPELFGDANGGYPAPIFLESDTAWLAAGGDEVRITITKDVHKIVTQLKPPGFRRELAALRFLKKDLERLARQLERDANPAHVIIAPAQESGAGIHRDQVLAAFAGLVRIDLAQALAAGGGIFGDDGARVKASTRKGKNNIVWNPVTLALGLNDVHRVPLSHLKRAFQTHDFLHEWAGEWDQSLALLGN